MSDLPAFRIVRFVLAPLLSFWVAGAGCMLGCEGMVAAASTEQPNTSHHAKRTSTIVASGNACSSAKSHSCCSEKSSESTASESKAQQDESSKVSDQHPVASRRSSSDPMNCPFAVSRAVVVGKAQGGEKKAVAVLAHSTLVTQGFAEQLVPLSRSLRLPNRGHTYLRCCVFLI